MRLVIKEIILNNPYSHPHEETIPFVFFSSVHWNRLLPGNSEEGA
jgi:hypothetical protein